MKNKISIKLASLALLAVVTTSFATAQSLTITGVVSETKGTNTTVAGGSLDNTDTFNLGTVGVFQMNNGYAYMKVSATNPTGGLTSGTDSLMVARTTNSQGLTDTGSLSVLVRPVNGAGVQTTSAWSLDVNFSFFTDATLTTPLNLGLQLTSLDIDYYQRYYTDSTDFTFNTTSGVGSNIVAAPSIAGYNGFTGAPDSTFNNPNAAVASWGYGNSFDVRLAHQLHPTPANPVVTSTAALYMFEFRQPSQATGLIPEPSSALLALTGITALGFVRRRKANA